MDSVHDRIRLRRRAVAATLTVGLLCAAPAVAGVNSEWDVPAQTISTPGKSAILADLAIADDGTRATAIWLKDGGSSLITTTRSATISGVTARWGEATDLTSPTGDNGPPQIAVSADGTRATATILGAASGRLVLQSRSASVAGKDASWGGLATVSDVGQDALAASLALSKDGRTAIAVWNRYNSSRSDIRFSTAVIDGPTAAWSPPADLSVTGQLAYSPQVALSDDGTRATAVWFADAAGGSVVQSRSATLSGGIASWGTVTPVSEAGQDAEAPKVALSADGTRALTTWYRVQESGSVVQARAGQITGNVPQWGTISTLSSLREQGAVAPQVALSDDGSSGLVVWTDGDGNNAAVRSRTSSLASNDATWSSSVTLSDDPPGAIEPQVGLSADGTRATAIWAGTKSDGIRTRSASISGGQADWGPTTDFAVTGQQPRKPALALSAAGDTALAAWTAGVGSGATVQATAGGLSKPLPRPTPTTEPTSRPTTEPTTGSKKTQTASVKVPKRIKYRGTTVLLKKAVRTNAEQKAVPRVIVTPKGRTYAKVTISSNGKVRVTTKGKRTMRIRLTLNAPEKGDYKPYTFTRRWLVKR